MIDPVSVVAELQALDDRRADNDSEFNYHAIDATLAREQEALLGALREEGDAAAGSLLQMLLDGTGDTRALGAALDGADARGAEVAGRMAAAYAVGEPARRREIVAALGGRSAPALALARQALGDSAPKVRFAAVRFAIDTGDGDLLGAALDAVEDDAMPADALELLASACPDDRLEWLAAMLCRSERRWLRERGAVEARSVMFRRLRGDLERRLGLALFDSDKVMARTRDLYGRAADRSAALLALLAAADCEHLTAIASGLELAGWARRDHGLVLAEAHWYAIGCGGDGPRRFVRTLANRGSERATRLMWSLTRYAELLDPGERRALRLVAGAALGEIALARVSARSLEGAARHRLLSVALADREFFADNAADPEIRDVVVDTFPRNIKRFQQSNKRPALVARLELIAGFGTEHLAPLVGVLEDMATHAASYPVIDEVLEPIAELLERARDAPPFRAPRPELVWRTAPLLESGDSRLRVALDDETKLFDHDFAAAHRELVGDDSGIEAVRRAAAALARPGSQMLVEARREQRERRQTLVILGSRAAGGQPVDCEVADLAELRAYLSTREPDVAIHWPPDAAHVRFTRAGREELVAVGERGLAARDLERVLAELAR